MDIITENFIVNYHCLIQQKYELLMILPLQFQNVDVNNYRLRVINSLKIVIVDSYIKCAEFLKLERTQYLCCSCSFLRHVVCTPTCYLVAYSNM
jgi:hypothetical protein